MTKKELFEEFKRVTHFNAHGMRCKCNKIGYLTMRDHNNNLLNVCESTEGIAVCIGSPQRSTSIITYFHDNESIRIPETGIGDLSDGYHTFNQLYHQRAILFATIVNQNKDKAWKSFKHDDGRYCFDSNGEWFIVGIDTPEGPYTYHYEIKYWNYFDCIDLPTAKPYDGHTEEDVTRLLSLI